MVEKGLPQTLWSLSKEIIAKVNEYKASGRERKGTRLYVKPQVGRFDYDEGNVGYQWSLAYIEKEEWHLEDRFHFLEGIKELPQYAALVSGISKEYKVNEPQAHLWVSTFVRNLVGKARDGTTDEILVDDITTFIGDLEKSSIVWDVKIWVEGVWLKQDSHEIYRGLTIRRPKPSDLEVEKPFDMLPAITGPRPPKEISSAVLELRYKSGEEGHINTEIEIILTSFRLFRLGSVFSIKTERHPRSFLTHSSTITPGMDFHEEYKYSIDEEDIPKLRDLIERIRSLSPREVLWPATGELTPVGIAFQRYNEAVLKPQSIESRITSAISCFEALYLKAGERMELSHRLGQRASAVLALFDFRPVQVYNAVKRAYHIRSTFIHGSQIKSEERRSATELAEKVLEYARISLLAFWQLRPIVDKEKFISKIDNALLDENARSKFRELITENCNIYR